LGGWRRPKSVGGLHGTEVPNQQGIASFDQYGWGEKDPITGQYEGYDLPREVVPTGEPVGWNDIIAQWSLLEADFSSEYGVELEDAFLTRSWRWFTVKLSGLLAADTRLSRHFRPEPPQEAPSE
jgi:hypothetical protein